MRKQRLQCDSWTPPCRQSKQTAGTILILLWAIMRHRTLKVERLGRVEYGAALEIQKQTERAVLTSEQPDTLLLLEHPHTLTRGRRSTEGGIVAPDQVL